MRVGIDCWAWSPGESLHRGRKRKDIHQPLEPRAGEEGVRVLSRTLWLRLGEWTVEQRHEGRPEMGCCRPGGRWPVWGRERETWRKILRGWLDLASIFTQIPYFSSFTQPTHARTHPQVYWSSPWHLTAKPETQAACAILLLFPLDPGAGTSSIFPQYHSSQRGLWWVGGLVRTIFFNVRS